MKKLDPNKLSVEFRNGVSKFMPINGRKYTLTHSDTTGELFLDIGLTYAYDKITSMRDEVLAEWKFINNCFVLYVYINVDGNLDEANLNKSIRRNNIFIRELTLALEALRYGDNSLYFTHPYLDNSPIYVYFDSIYPSLNRVEYWKTPSNYR